MQKDSSGEAALVFELVQTKILFFFFFEGKKNGFRDIRSVFWAPDCSSVDVLPV